MEPFITSDGREIPLKRVARRHVDRIRTKYHIPDAPTYTVTLVGGGIQTFPHEHRIIDGKLRSTLETPEDHKLWNEYQEELEKVTTEQLEETTKFLIYSCVDMEVPNPNDWEFDFDLWGAELPDDSDPVAYKLEWFESELVTDPDDYAGIMTRLWVAGGLLEEGQAREFELFFRTVLARLSTS